MVAANTAPDSMTINIVDVYRLVRLAVKEATVRSIHQRRVAIATVTDTLRTMLSIHAVMLRAGTTEPYKPTLGSPINCEAA